GSDRGAAGFDKVLYFWSFDAFSGRLQLLSVSTPPGDRLPVQSSFGFSVSIFVLFGAYGAGIQSCPSICQPAVWGVEHGGMASVYPGSFRCGPPGECAGFQGGYDPLSGVCLSGKVIKLFECPDGGLPESFICG